MKHRLSGIGIAASAAVIIIVSSGTAQSEVIYVNDDAVGYNDGTSWHDAFLFLQDALVTAENGDEIWVAEGTYTPDLGEGRAAGNRNEAFQLENGVRIYGGFDGTEVSFSQRAGSFDQTILSGDLNRDDLPEFGNYGENSFHVVTGAGADDTAVLDGFLITGGNANGGGSAINGGGMLNESGNPTVKNCKFRENTAGNVGGAVYSNFGSPLFTDCIFEGNTAANFGGALYLGTGGAPILFNSIFVGNSAGQDGGAIFLASVAPEATNCLFSGNDSGQEGGAIYLSNSTATLTNVTLGGNSAGTTSGGIFGEGNATAIVTNSVLWGNVDSTGTGENAQINDGIVTYSTIQDDFPGGLVPFGGAENNNKDRDPLYVDPEGEDNDPGTLDDNLRLSPGSPALDVGDNSALPADQGDLDGDGDTTEVVPFDLDGFRRISNDVVDMGAYELPAFVRIECGGLSACPQGTFVYRVTANNLFGLPLELTVNVLPTSGIPGSPQLASSVLDDGDPFALTQEFRTPGTLPNVCPTTVTLQATLQTDLGEVVAVDTCSIEFAPLEP